MTAAFHIDSVSEIADETAAHERAVWSFQDVLEVAEAVIFVGDPCIGFELPAATSIAAVIAPGRCPWTKLMK